MSLRDALDSWPEPEGSFDEVLEQSAQRVFNDGAAHPVEPAPVASRERVAEVLAAHNIECTGPGEVACRGCRDKGWMSWSDYRHHVADALLAAGVFSEPQSECGAVDRTGKRRCVFTPGHHEVGDWTSHADRDGWTWNDQPAEAKVVHSGTGPCDCWACSPEDES